MVFSSSLGLGFEPLKILYSLLLVQIDCVFDTETFEYCTFGVPRPLYRISFIQLDPNILFFHCPMITIRQSLIYADGPSLHLSDIYLPNLINIIRCKKGQDGY